MACVDDRMYVTVPVTALWTSARAPRAIDGPAVAGLPDVGGWLRLLDDAVPDGRLGLHGRVLTQLELGEPVLVLDRTEDGWAEVVCPWQPSSLDARGYPGWVPLSHLGADRPGDAAAAPDHATDGGTNTPRVEGTFLEQAGRHVGLRYL